jgi:hypothetical protein
MNVDVNITTIKPTRLTPMFMSTQGIETQGKYQSIIIGKMNENDNNIIVIVVAIFGNVICFFIM